MAPVLRLDAGRCVVELMRFGMPVRSSERRRWQWAERNVFSRLAFDEKVDPPGRCLIPMDSFALPDGSSGQRTRSWFGLWDDPLFACAGVWRTFEGLNCFLGMATPANALVARVGRTMPVILSKEGHGRWLNGDLLDVMELCRRPIPNEIMWLEQTDELWSSGRSVAEVEAGRRPYSE
jgi:putative SOS response-associated peptidase YedK